MTDAGQAIPESDRWNHNIHYHPLLLARGPAQRALDVGCGEGMLCRQLGAICTEVVGIDSDPASIALARETTGAANVSYLRGDVMVHDLEPASFDLVVSVATLHHIDTRAALRRLADLTAPGGVVGIIGIGRRRLPHDLLNEVAAATGTRFHKYLRRKRYWEHDAPTVWPPPDTYGRVREIAERELPGSNFRRLMLWRYLLTWTKPQETKAD